jgi:hypothetical protein
MIHLYAGFLPSPAPQGAEGWALRGWANGGRVRILAQKLSVGA